MRQAHHLLRIDTPGRGLVDITRQVSGWVTSTGMRDGLLIVRARDASWQREVERSTPLIRSRLHSLLGDDVVRYIDVRSG